MMVMLIIADDRYVGDTDNHGNDYNHDVNSDYGVGDNKYYNDEDGKVMTMTMMVMVIILKTKMSNLSQSKLNKAN